VPGIPAVQPARVEEDLRSGAQSGIPSTPPIHLGSATEPELRRVIEAASG
jgi:hypothetical protein